MKTKNSTPIISVIMGVYNQNDEKMIRSAIYSILNQTFSDLEFIIYNDGSDERCSKLLKDICNEDQRIKLIGRTENHGLGFSLNECISYAKGKYIARMDSDDFSYPERLETEYQFLETHPEYDWCGCNAKLVDDKGAWGTRIMTEVPGDRDYLRFSPYIHPTVMYRKEVFEIGRYSDEPDTLRCEDYEIFMRFHRKGLRGYNIQKIMFDYREDSVSVKRRKMKFRMAEARVRYKNYKKMHLLFPTGWIYVLRPVLGGLVPMSFIQWLKKEKHR